VRWALLLVASTAFAGRPPEALDADRTAAEADLHALERRAKSLGEQADDRRDRLRKRLRSLYKLSSGGVLRLLVESGSTADLAAREAAVKRVLERDLDELRAVADEAKIADSETEHAKSQAEKILVTASSTEKEASGLAKRRGKLPRPVQSAVQSAFGLYKEGDAQLARRGVEMRASAGEPVRTIAAGTIRWIGDAPGIGRTVAVDHGEGWLTLYARLKAEKVQLGEQVGDGQAIGEALGPTIYFELSQGGTALNPFGWLLPPTK
jgi:septal ring factor EnvC (AmiA/AmiB activator)